MNTTNHIFVSGETNLSQLEKTLETHGGSVSYIKIGGITVPHVDVERVCSMVRGSDISVCVGGSFADECKRRSNRFDALEKLGKRGVDGVEISTELLYEESWMTKMKDLFRRRVVEVGVKDTCSAPENQLSRILADIKKADEEKVDHIVLEGSLSGDCGIYHGNSTPNILLVDEIMWTFSDRSRCIIEGPHKKQQDLWRAMYGPETHIGNIANLSHIGATNESNVNAQYGHDLRKVRERMKKIAQDNGINWDIIVRNYYLVISLFEDLGSFMKMNDGELLKIMRSSIQSANAANEFGLDYWEVQLIKT